MTAPATTSATSATNATNAAKWHGYLLAGAGLPLPVCVTKTDQLARPDYTNVNASEYIDTPEALNAKADALIALARQSQRAALFLGAGISTSSGVRDYASGARGSVVQPQQRRLTHDFVLSLRPTPAHRVLAALYRSGALRVRDTVQQNHDGLLNKAGMPQAVVNEIHGAWLDSKANPVVPMSGSLRSDLFERVLKLEEEADFCLAVGTSFSGLNVDRVANSVARRHRDKGAGFGLVAVSIQQTPMDEKCAVRVFAKCDDFLMLVAAKLGLAIDFETDYDYATGAPVKFPASANHHPYKTGAPVAIPGAPATSPAVRAAAPAAPTAAAPTAAAAAPATVAVATRSLVPPTAATTTTTTATSAATAPTATPAPAASTAQPLKIVVGNRHELVARASSSDDEAAAGGAPNNRHRWTMFVRAAPAGAVQGVVFHLHPTFRENRVKVDAAVAVAAAGGAQELAITRVGWGTFDVKCVVTLRDGKTETFTHSLSFDAPETSATVLARA
jgi:NAD-dependent SIR2 family protein deacetylase